jgi:hypothetical protein
VSDEVVQFSDSELTDEAIYSNFSTDGILLQPANNWLAG